MTLPKKFGVLLINLGTPVSLKWWDIALFLREFLSDKSVVRLPFFIWAFILYGFILPLRPFKLRKMYRKIWHYETDEAPLRFHTRRQAERLAQKKPHWVVDWAMRYGSPPIEAKLKKLKKMGCTHLRILPLYPQYARATTGSVHDEVKRHLGFDDPVILSYYNHPAYIESLSLSLKRYLTHLNWEPERILLSFHSLPKREIERGDPYEEQCQKTRHLLQVSCQHYGIFSQPLMLSYQSRFGARQWLEPSTLTTIQQLAQQGIKRLVILCPGFASDCLETLEEIDELIKTTFLKQGGERFGCVPCLNASDESISMLTKLLETYEI